MRRPLAQRAPQQVFVMTKTYADELSEKLWQENIDADAMHGGRNQEKRLSVRAVHFYCCLPSRCSSHNS